MIAERDYEARVLGAMREAVAEVLERKRRLGQYVVVWRSNGPTLIGPDVPPELVHYRRSPPDRPFGVAEPGDGD